MDKFESIFAAARKSYILKLPEKFVQIDTLIDKLLENNKDEDNLNELYRLIHGISGSSGMLGLTDLSKNAQKLEAYLIQFIKPTSDIEIDLEKIISVIDKLKVYVEVDESL